MSIISLVVFLCSVNKDHFGTQETLPTSTFTVNTSFKRKNGLLVLYVMIQKNKVEIERCLLDWRSKHSMEHSKIYSKNMLFPSTGDVTALTLVR